MKSGRIKLLRKVEFKVPESSQEASDIAQLIRDPTLQEYDTGKVESKLLEIDDLACGDCFGEYASILKENVQYSVVTAIPTEVYSIDLDDFALLGRDFAESILKFAKAVPSDIDLRRAFIEMNRWNEYKTGMTKSVKAEMVNTRHTYD